MTKHMKSAWKEFTEFYASAYRTNKKLTILATIFLIVAVFDEIRGFKHGHGTMRDILDWIIQYKAILFH